MNFKGFDDYIPIFRGGKQTDSNGVVHDGDALIDKAIAKFNAAVHEPPACIGHPKDDAPAYGWVKGLKKGADKLGTLLLAQFGQVEPTFGTMVKDGRLKKRSAAFYPDGTLRHVAFLGAMPPAVKGLPDVAFAEGDAASFEFSDYETVWAWKDIARLFGKIRDYLIEKEGVEKADQIIDKYNIEEISAKAATEEKEANDKQTRIYNEKEDQEIMNFKEKMKAFLTSIGFDVSKIPDAAIPGEAPASTGQQFSEADLEKIRTEAEAKGKQKAETQFAEQQKQTKLAGIKTEIASFCESLIKAGKITPATVAFGLPEILFSMAEIDNQIEFGEKKEKFTVFDRMKALLESATPLISFTETATRDKGTGGANKREGVIAKFMEDNKVGYKEAVLAVSKENPELFKEEE